MARQDTARYPKIEGEILRKFREDGVIDEVFEKEVTDCFREAVVQLCSRMVGRYLFQVSCRRGVSQADLARETGKAKSTVHLWFNQGIRSFEGLVLAISELNIEFHTLPFPSLEERTTYGYRKAITYVQTEKLRAECNELSEEEWEYLIELFSTLEWQCALALPDETTRLSRLGKIAGKFADRIQDRTGKRPQRQGYEQVAEIFDTWKDAFQLCLDTVPIRWQWRGEYHEVHTQ